MENTKECAFYELAKLTEEKGIFKYISETLNE
jgi:hypothetical protein